MGSLCGIFIIDLLFDRFQIQSPAMMGIDFKSTYEYVDVGSVKEDQTTSAFIPVTPSFCNAMTGMLKPILTFLRVTHSVAICHKLR